MTMRIAVILAVALTASLNAQEPKPAPKDSVRVFLPGCSKDRTFTVGPRTEDAPGRFDIPKGMHLRMNGPKALMTEIKAHEGSMIQLTGLMRKGQYGPEGVGIGGGVRISPGPTGGDVSRSANYSSQVMIDVEGWRPVAGDCPVR